MLTSSPGRDVPAPGLPAACARRLRFVASLLERERERWVLWLPVALGLGAVGYFLQPREPGMAIATLTTIGVVGAAIALRRRPALAAIALLVAAIASGFALAQLRASRVAAPVLAQRWGPAELTARVVAVEVRPEGRRLILDRLALPGLPQERTPQRVRVKLRESHALPVAGERIAVRAQLVPPPEPVAPGGYDFARWAWFERIGAVGSARAAPRILSSDDVGVWRLRLNAARTALVERVLAIDAGQAGQVTAALLTGEMGHIDPELMAAMRDSGLAHLLSISGLHISLVAGIVFFALRRLVALAPALALRWPAKKLAAGGAFLAITAYMLFAAPGVPTTRAWFMGSIVLLAVVLDRAPLSMRLVAWAATAILALWPEALLGPSFQMSFAAVVALIAAWETIAPRLRRWRESAGAGRRALLLVAAGLATTLIASCATAPFALYHFNRVALFSIAANLVAVPLTSILVMPAAVLVFVLLPFGWEEPAVAAMNAGNFVVAAIAREVASWPSAAVPVPAMPDWGFAAAVAGGLWLCLWRARWRLAGVPLIAVGLASPFLASPPDVLLGGEGRLIAVRLADGGLAAHGSGNVELARETWSRRSGREAPSAWSAAGRDLSCRPGLCWIERPGHHVALVTAANGLAEACEDATMLIATLEVWRDCRSPRWLIDRAALARSGAHAIRLLPGGDVRIETVSGVRGERPWTRRAAQ